MLSFLIGWPLTELLLHFLWTTGFASSTSPDAIDTEKASGGAVMPGSVGTILGETLFAGKVVYFERGNDDAQPGDADFGRIGFGRGQNCFGPSNHASVDVLASEGRLAKDVEGLGPVRVVATSDVNALGPANGAQSPKATIASIASKTTTTGTTTGNLNSTSDSSSNDNSSQIHQVHFGGFSGPIRLMGGAGGLPLSLSLFGGENTGLLQALAAGLLVAMMAGML